MESGMGRVWEGYGIRKVLGGSLRIKYMEMGHLVYCVFKGKRKENS